MKNNNPEPDSLTVLDLLESASMTKSGKEMISGLFDLLSLFIDASTLVFLSSGDDDSALPVQLVRGDPGNLAGEMRAWMTSSEEAWKVTEDGSAFFVRIVHHETLFGVIAASGFAFPQYLKRYLSRSKSIIRILSPIIANHLLIKRVDRLSHTDFLTGLENRNSFHDLGTTEMARVKRYGSKLTAVVFDVDFFKSVNDSYGSSAGDHVLRAVSECAKNQMRDTDRCGRLDGAVCAFLLPETAIDQAFVFAERFRKTVENLQIPWKDQVIKVTVSLGLSQAISAGMTGESALDALLARCDEALALAKKNGRNRCELYRVPPVI